MLRGSNDKRRRMASSAPQPIGTDEEFKTALTEHTKTPENVIEFHKTRRGMDAGVISNSPERHC